jgi:hypothetical protein
MNNMVDINNLDLYILAKINKNYRKYVLITLLLVAIN